MNELRIATRNEQTSFRPGEELHGAAGWRLDQLPARIEARLFYYTRGRGTEDVVVVQRTRFDPPQQEGARPFQFTLPDAPYSFSGKLLSIIWALELVAEPGGRSARFEFVMSPSGTEIVPAST
jgi:hypothetical protein